MPENIAKGEMHGCIVCGKLYQMYVIHDANGKYVGSKVMSAGGKEVKDAKRPLAACEKHTDAEIERAVKRAFGDQVPEED
jgi:succinate dehydrogenase/fumarate reductase-like Fe-S protein